MGDYRSSLWGDFQPASEAGYYSGEVGPCPAVFVVTKLDFFFFSPKVVRP